MLVRTPSVHTSTPPIIWMNTFATDKFIILYTTALDLVALEQNRVIPSKILMYEFETGQINEVTFANGDDEDNYIHPIFPLDKPYPVEAPKNMIGIHINELQIQRNGDFESNFYYV